MNEATIESIEWHKDQVFKLLDNDDLYKEESSIQSVKSNLNEIIEKAKSRKRVWVKATATKKGHYREQEVGRKEEEKKPVGVTLDSVKSLMDDIGLGESQGVGDRGIQVYYDMLRRAIDVKMNYSSRDKETSETRSKNSDKIKSSLDKSGIEYTTKTDVMMPGQVYFTIKSD